MFLSRIKLNLSGLTPAMWQKWQSAQPYASHQWLWQLFSEQQQRQFLFRHEPGSGEGVFYVQSEYKPQSAHPMFSIESKVFQPQITEGMKLCYSLRANPVVTRQGKRSDVMMDAKFHARLRGIEAEESRPLQVKAAWDWLFRQGEKGGFIPHPDEEHFVGSQLQRFTRPGESRSIVFSSVDYGGSLTVNNPELFLQTLKQGMGKSKALGCGLLLIRRG